MKICKKTTITDHGHLNLVSVDYQDRNGTAKKWIYATRGNSKRPDAVVVVPFHSARKKLVLIREFRVPLEGFQYGFPAGLVDPGEDVETAGKRELFEETGLRATRVLGQSPPVYSSSGMTDENISLVFVECDGLPSNDHNEASEEIEVLMLSVEEADSLLSRADCMFDVKTWIVLERFASTGCVI
jgi:ADP-ribose pyrophosphatase